MDRLTAMQVFTEVAERGSLTAAGAALEMSRAMVSRHLESLEHWLGVRLLHRTTRRVSLTDAGSEALERCLQVLSLSREVQAVADVRRAAPAGRLRITTSASFAEAHLASAVADFLALNPHTEVELIALERAVNLVEERIDLAVRIGKQLDDSLVARRLADCRSALCASPAYLAAHGMPAAPEDLRAHRCVIHAHFGRTEFRLKKAGREVKVPVRGPLQSNSAGISRRAALEGVGIALLPTYLVSSELSAGLLTRVLPDWEPETVGIHAAYLSRQHQPRLLRAMLDFLVERFAGDVAPWDRTAASAPATPARQGRRGARR